MQVTDDRANRTAWRDAGDVCIQQVCGQMVDEIVGDATIRSPRAEDRGSQVEVVAYSWCGVVRSLARAPGFPLGPPRQQWFEGGIERAAEQ